MHHTLHLASALDVAGVSTVLKTLRSLPGVNGVEAISGANIVAVNFDDHRTSLQEMGAVLARAGYPAKQRHSGGGCCGGCGC
jgi:copper chaperone CopZ